MNNQIEIRILQIIEEIAMTSVSLDDLLLDANLIDSISAVDLALRIEDEFHCAIPPQEITEHMKSARTLSSYVQQQH
ncbi:acyl carrier protein [Janthinobacterium sp. LB2P49]|uniref:acyl carrier protein n=1 Tax=Janthinobacterium sp. LB2P49 TaxID=3424198 RepID=UPI003F209A0E